ncbi:uncharacterized protein LOC122465326 isoform X3 [Chelonia mydas]|uniref:uncharacterized protein LOC122465326 isoform X3 n=1 Tax=Chelonia mydas TaxID=8469 RepID=UPI001CA93788|nr:uncharacterized protein LOC122465326 isoform X3 [Chelonia mydas]
MSMYKTPTEAKKPELPLGAPVRVQKRRPFYAYFANEAGPLLNPVFHPEIEPKKQEDFMEPQPFVKEKKDKVRKNLLSALEEADSKAEVGMEEEPVYEDMATEGPLEDSDVENQPINPKSWKDGDVVTGKATEVHDETSSEDEEDKERWPLRRITMICTCCFCMKQDCKKKSVKSKEGDQQSCEDDVMADIIRAVVVKTIYHCLQKQLLENCAACVVGEPNSFSHPCIFWGRSEVFHQIRHISSKLNVTQLLNVIIAEGYELKKLNMTTETVTEVVKMIREVAETSDPVVLLVDLSNEVAAKIGRSVCSRIRKMDCKTFYMPAPHPKG